MNTLLSFTCMDYFSNETLIQAVATPNWQNFYYDVRNYCLYCNHSTGTEFQQAILTNTSVLYFWRHESAICNQNPALLFFSYSPYFDRLKSSNSSLLKLSPDKLSDFLILTSVRTLTSDYIGENARSDLFYVCMFLDVRTYGFTGDVWENSIVPVRYQIMWIIDFIIRFIIAFFMIILLWIPKIKHWISVQKIKNVPKIELILQMVSSLQTQVLICDTFSVLVGFLEDFMFFQTTPPGYRSIGGVFRVASYAFISLATFILLLLWAFIVHRATNMHNSQILPRKFLIALALIYSFAVLYGISGILVMLVSTSPSSRYLGTGSIIIVASFFSFIFLVGFSIYGIRILWLFKNGRSKTDLLQLRVTRLLLLSNFMWSLVIPWLIVFALSYFAPQTMYTFFVVYNVQFLDAASVTVILTHMIIIFQYDQFVECYRFLAKLNSTKPTIQQ
jgi:hypothetical protein